MQDARSNLWARLANSVTSSAERSYQLTMKLVLSQMRDHHGRYMSGLGFIYQKHKILAEVGEDDNLAGQVNNTHIRTPELSKHHAGS